MEKSTQIKKMLDESYYAQNALFSGGYLITSEPLADLNSYPFYGNWKSIELATGNGDSGDLHAYCHKKESLHSYSEDGKSILMVGHAYNPFSMCHVEEELLRECLNEYSNSLDGFFNKVSELTGIHVVIVNDGGRLFVVQDCGGMKACYYGMARNKLVLTSHPQLVDDVYGLTADADIQRLTKKWFFSLSGKYLPGDLSPFTELTRLGPNTFMTYDGAFSVDRFYPKVAHRELEEKEFSGVTQEISRLINNNIALCAMKWAKPTISLSGGMDSKTTLACANGFYDKYSFFSFQSKPQEEEDAQAARRLCESINASHVIYDIPDENEEFEDFELFKKIIAHNSSYIGNPKDNEIRKFIYLHKLNDFDVELKSWISEIGRLMWGKKYGLNLPKVLSPRHFSIFQTRYLGSPSLLKHADENYKKYLDKISLSTPPYNYDHSDMFYWEFRFGSWGSNAFSMQDIFSHTVTMPLNNRKIIDMFLWFPDEKRKADFVNKSIIKFMNKDIYDLDVDVKNMYLRGKRVMVEKVYYYYRIYLKAVRF